jgi:hypothetical protein
MVGDPHSVWAWHTAPAHQSANPTERGRAPRSPTAAVIPYRSMYFTAQFTEGCRELCREEGSGVGGAVNSRAGEKSVKCGTHRAAYRPPDSGNMNETPAPSPAWSRPKAAWACARLHGHCPLGKAHHAPCAFHGTPLSPQTPVPTWHCLHTAAPAASAVPAHIHRRS